MENIDEKIQEELYFFGDINNYQIIIIVNKNRKSDFERHCNNKRLEILKVPCGNRSEIIFYKAHVPISLPLFVPRIPKLSRRTSSNIELLSTLVETAFPLTEAPQSTSSEGGSIGSLC